MARVNIVKQVKNGKRWKMVSIPRHRNGNYNWKELPEGGYFIEWYEGRKRRREAAGFTASQALNVARRKRHELEGRALGITTAEPGHDSRRTPLHLAVKRYLDVVEALKKRNTARKYQAVLNRFLDYFSENTTAQRITTERLNEYMAYLRSEKKLGNNSVTHNMVIIAQFLKKQGRPGITRHLDLPHKVDRLPQEYTDEDLKAFFAGCTAWEHALFSTFLLTGFREHEIVHLYWNDINFKLNTLQIRAKPDLDFYPKRWEDREVPVPKKLTTLLSTHARTADCPFVFPSPRGNRELHMLDKCKNIAERAQLNPANFTLRKFRSTYATRMLRAGFDVRTVQH